MKKFISKVIIFLFGLVVFDCIIGFGCRYLVNHAKGGDTGLGNYINFRMREECIIFGSSRGMHHYDPNIIIDSLGLSCWNCSLDGNGIVFMYGRYKMLSARYTPKLIIYDIEPSFDMLAGDNATYLGRLRYYYDEPSVDSIFWAVDKTERYKMMSNCYRYNSSWLQLISDNIHPLQTDDKGYRPMDKKMIYKPKKSETSEPVYEYDSLKLSLLKRLVMDCNAKGTQLVFAASPKFGKTDDIVYQPLKDICRQYNVPFINHYCDKEFVFDYNYFYDSVHMNRTGATRYTKKIVGELRTISRRCL